MAWRHSGAAVALRNPPAFRGRTTGSARHFRGVRSARRLSRGTLGPAEEDKLVGSHRHRDRNAILDALPFGGGRGGSVGGAARFSGFDQISFSARTHWEYSWRETSITNGEVDPEKSGVVRVEL